MTDIVVMVGSGAGGSDVLDRAGMCGVVCAIIVDIF